MPKGVFWEVWRSSRGYVACRFFVSSCLSFWHLACLCSLFELESLVYSLNEFIAWQSPWFLCDCIDVIGSLPSPASQLRGKTNPTFLCVSWFLKRMYRPCLMIIIKSCSVKLPELFTSSHGFICISCSVLITYKSRPYICFFVNCMYCPLAMHVISTRCTN